MFPPSVCVRTSGPMGSLFPTSAFKTEGCLKVGFFGQKSNEEKGIPGRLPRSEVGRKRRALQGRLLALFVVSRPLSSSSCPLSPSGPAKGGRRRVEGPKGEAKKFAFFSHSSTLFFFRCLFSRGVFSWNCGRGSRPWTTQIGRLLGLLLVILCEPRRPQRPLGFHTIHPREGGSSRGRDHGRGVQGERKRKKKKKTKKRKGIETSKGNPSETARKFIFLQKKGKEGCLRVGFFSPRSRKGRREPVGRLLF